MSATPTPPVIITRWDVGGDEWFETCSVEADAGQVNVTFKPYDTDAETFSMPPREAWKLAQELARYATEAEQQDAD